MEKTEKTTSTPDQFINMEGINRFPERLIVAMGGMTNVELGGLCGLSEATVRNYRKGKNYPPLDKLQLIAEACGCSVEWLVTGRTDDGKKCDSEKKYDSQLREEHPSGIERNMQVIRAIGDSLELQQRELFYKLLAGKAGEFLAQLNNDDVHKLSLLEGRKLEAALMLENMPDERVREILEAMESADSHFNVTDKQARA
ncbi:helix-turn-helix domain-containing protein [Salmonella enterica]|nr:helix-turn-helix domain-containing protein [Salmonella enterica]